MSETNENRRHSMVTLGGREFTIYAASIRHSRAWRERFSEPIQNLIGLLQNAGKIQLQDDDGNLNLAVAASLFQQLGHLLLGSMDMLADAMFNYSPELHTEQDWILDHATDEDVLLATWEVIKMAYPFGNLVALINRGAASIGTSRNSAGPRGKQMPQSTTS